MACFLTASASPVYAADCSKTTTGLMAIPDLGAQTYKGEQGGLYPGGTNEPPAAYQKAGVEAARAVKARAQDGRPDSQGKFVLLSVGMSNATQEFSVFVNLAQSDALKNARLAVVDGAQGGQDAKAWTQASAKSWAVVDDRLREASLSRAQVAAIWLKEAQAQPSGELATHTAALAADLACIVEVATARFPNLQQVFVSPRTYAGYATTRLNPEPYAYETGFADRQLVAKSVNSPASRPWIGWGPYLWTDGALGRKDGFVWTCDDVQADGTHPSDQGRRKVGELLQRFVQQSAFTSWYREPAPTPRIREFPGPPQWPWAALFLVAAALVAFGFTRARPRVR